MFVFRGTDHATIVFKNAVLCMIFKEINSLKGPLVVKSNAMEVQYFDRNVKVPMFKSVSVFLMNRCTQSNSLSRTGVPFSSFLPFKISV